MSYYRIQEANDPAERILTVDGQISHNWDDMEDTRAGVSACESIEELATYLAGTGIPFGHGDWILIRFDGDQADELDHDHELGAVLTIPTSITEVQPLEDCTEFWDAIDAAYEAAA